MPESLIQRRILYHDTDAGGVVYYAKYLEHLEEGRFEYCLERGVDLGALMARGTAFPVVHLEMDFKAPARYGDVISVATQIEKIGTSSVHFLQEIRRDGGVLVKTKTVWACVDAHNKPQPVPDDIRQVLLR